MEEEKKVKPRGFAAFSPEQRTQFARAGGLKVSQNRQSMVERGKRGGQKVFEQRGPEYFRELAQKAVQKRKANKEGERE